MKVQHEGQTYSTYYIVRTVEVTAINLIHRIIHVFSSPLERYAYQFKRAYKFILNHSIEIRVFQGAKEMGHQWIPFHQACESWY